MVQIRIDKYDTIDKIEARMLKIQETVEKLSLEAELLEEKFYELKKPGFKIPIGGFKNDKQSKKTSKNSASAENTKQKTTTRTKKEEKIT